jgi:hypothetical protein
MSTTARRRVELTHTQHYPAPVDEVFPLLCPVREHDYLPPWQAEIIHLGTGLAEQGGVFVTTGEQGGRDVWVISRYEPLERIQFVRVDALRTIVYDLYVEPAADGGTQIRWDQQVTALSQDGDDHVAGYIQADFAMMLKMMARLLAHYLKTGSMLVQG